jgi:hypothetical protein
LVLDAICGIVSACLRTLWGMFVRLPAPPPPPTTRVEALFPYPQAAAYTGYDVFAVEIVGLDILSLGVMRRGASLDVFWDFKTIVRMSYEASDH